MDIINEVKSKKLMDKNKLCIICEETNAEYCIKDLRKDCYCKKCAEDSFGDLGLLQQI